MCEFCLKHGEGKKWYLQAKNYSACQKGAIHLRARSEVPAVANRW